MNNKSHISPDDIGKMAQHYERPLPVHVKDKVMRAVQQSKEQQQEREQALDKEQERDGPEMDRL